MKRMFKVLLLVGLVGCGQPNLGGSSAQVPPTPVPATQVPPTPVATVQPSPPPATAVVGIINGSTGFVLGGAQGGAWIDPLTTAASLTANQRYTLYSPVARIGDVIGEAPLPPQAEPCMTENPSVKLQATEVGNTLALNADWEVFPRQVTEIPLDTAMYQDAVRDFLLTQGISNTEIVLTRVVRVDLEGDGATEVLINATQKLPREGLGLDLTALAGEYSVVLVQRMVAGKAVNVPVEGDYYPQTKEWAALKQLTLRSVADLNGDGDLEIVVDSSRYEGSGMSIYEISGNEAKKVLIGGCESL